MNGSAQAVFLSYASQDAAEVARLAEALRAAGVEVWFDRNELVGGDAWDAKIRGQIAACALFVPVISAQTQARLEGYFRIEWKLAARRTHAMAAAKAFVLPVVIDGTRDGAAHVPDEFREVQWTRLPEGAATEKFCARVRQLLNGTDRGEIAASGVAVPMPAATSPTRKRSTRVVVLAAVVILLGISAWWSIGRAPFAAARSPSVVPTADAKSAPPTVSEARRLSAQAQTILLKTELGLTELDAATILSDRATALDPSDPEAWATASEVDTWRFYFGGEKTRERRESARTKAARAINLAAQAYPARRAQAAYLICVAGGEAAQEAEPVLRALLLERPRDVQVTLLLGFLLRNRDRTDESIAAFEQLATLPGQAARAYNEIAWLHAGRRRFEDADRAIDRSIESEPFTGNVSLKVLLAQNWLGDNAAALATLKKLPQSKWTDDRALAAAIRVFHWGGDPKSLLDLLGNVAGDWITWSIEGPKAAITGDAHAQLNHQTAARNDWSSALAQVELRLAKNPNDWKLNVWKAYLLSALGQPETADRALTLARETAGTTNGQFTAWLVGSPQTYLAYNLLPRLVPPADLLAELQKRVSSAGSCPPLANLRLNPSLASVRQLPAFAGVLEAAAAYPATAPAGKSVSASAAAAMVDQKSVAVLPFKNLSGDPAREFLSDGLSEAVTDVLGRVPGLKVVGSASAFSFKGKSVPIPEIARQLGVTHLVDGAVIQDGQTVRITAKLIQADGFQVWVSDKLDRELKAIFALHDEVAGLIAENLSLKLGTSSAASRAPVNPEALELFVRGREAWKLRTFADYDRAEELLNRALALEPNFARAHAALADVWFLRAQDQNTIGGFEQRDSPELRRIVARINRALTHDPELAEAHASLGGVAWVAWQFTEGERELRRAIALNPNYATAHQWLGRLLLTAGRMDEALAELKRATEIEPLAPRILDNYGIGLALAGRYREALAAYDRALALQPNSVQALRQKAQVLAASGRLPEAVTMVQTIPLEAKNSGGRVARVVLLAQAGRKSEAEALLTGFDPKDRRSLIASLLAVGRGEEALSQLTPAVLLAPDTGNYLFDAFYDPVRNDSRWVKVIAEVGLTEAHARAQEWRAAHPPEKPELKK